jgi:hypothetical protein
MSIHQSGSSSSSAEVADSEVGLSNESLVLPAAAPSPSYLIPPLTDPEQAYFWATDWQAAERAAEAELQRGEAPSFSTVDDAMRWLLSNE